MAFLNPAWHGRAGLLVRKSVVAGGLGLLLAGPLSACLCGQAGEYQVKAAFLFNFAKFVEWPGPDPANDPINLCVVGDDPFGSLLDQMVKGKLANGRAMEIRRISPGVKFERCQIAFIAASERKRLPALLESLGHAGVLTVGETDDFARGGGIISFFLDNNHVRLEVNVDAADRAGLKISSKLLSLAKIVRDPSGGKT